MAYDNETFITDNRGLPFCSQQAFTLSHDYIERYLEQHALESTGLDERRASLIAAARLEWVLRQTRRELRGLFSVVDLGVLLDCFQGTLVGPCDLTSLAGDLCDRYGFGPSEMESPVGPLVSKFNALTPSQHAAIADAIEQAWHRGVKLGVPPEDVFRALEIELCDE